VNRRTFIHLLNGCLVLAAVAAAGFMPRATLAQDAPTGAIKTEVVKTDAGFELRRAGKPFIVKGVGGDFSKKKLVEIGGNAYRTWGVPSRKELDDAQALGLGVCVGIWLGNNPAAINGALPGVEKTVREFKDHPAVLMWAIGNEMENAQPDNAALWEALNKLAVAVKKIDPNHPTMTVIAEMGKDNKKIQMFDKYCPDFDICGINSYAGAPAVFKRYKDVGGTRPYLITEYGPPGQWESAKTPWKAAVELSSTEKGDRYLKAWTDGVVAAKGTALGSFAFLWGNKNEATPTWYGMMLPDGSTLEPMEILQKEWTGKYPDNRCPKIKSIKVDGENSIAANTAFKATVDVSDPENDTLKYEWILRGDSRDNSYGGNAKAATEALAGAITNNGGNTVDVKLPGTGAFRLFVYIHDGKGNAAVGNICLQGK
jgi:hypothetical protein